MAASWRAGLHFRRLLRVLRDYLGAGAVGRRKRVADRESLQYFLASRSSHVAQTALYGYLKTRAGTRFPELFADDGMLRSINMAKWQVWLACLSDLSIYAGGLVAQRSHAPSAAVGRLMGATVEAILAQTGLPDEAGPGFAREAERLRIRSLACDWSVVQDDDTPFSESPSALVRWAPVVDEFKQLDEEIVRNSVRFRWQEVRRDLRRDLDAEALMASAQHACGRSPDERA
jgi:hypothetical protein